MNIAKEKKNFHDPTYIRKNKINMFLLFLYYHYFTQIFIE